MRPGWKPSLPKKRVRLALFFSFAFLLFYHSEYEVPILMYHHVGAASEASGPTVSAETFERQMEFLKLHRYRVMRLEEIAERLKSGRPLPPNAVAITFDDGTVDNFDEAFPILKKMDFPATIFVITNNINKKGSLSEEDLRILDEAGVAIGSHTESHAFLPGLTRREAVWELAGSKKRLEAILGHPVRLFSYPAGGTDETIKALVRAQGYAAAVTTNYGNKRHDPYALHRIKIGESKGSLFNFWIKLSGLYQLGKKRISQ